MRAQDAKSCYLLLSRPRPILAETLIFHDLSSLLLRSSQIFSDLLSLSSLFKNSSEFWIEAELRVEYDGLAAANEVWSTL